MNKKLTISAILLILVFTSQSASAFLPLGGNNIIIQQITSSGTGKQGTYNQTLANNVLINKNGFKMNFINGSNNPVNIVNDSKRNQINVTISTMVPVSGVISLNALTGALTIACVSGNTTCTTSGGNTITVNTAWNVVTTGLSAQEITKQITIDNLVLGGNGNGNNKDFSNLRNLNATKVFQNGNQVIDTLSQSTGISISGSGNSRTIASTVVDTNTAQLGNSGTHTSILGTHPNATLNNVKTIVGTGCVTISSNSTDVQISCNAGGTGIITSQNIGKGSGSSGVLTSPTSSIIKGKNMTSLRSDLFTISNNSTDINFASNFKSNSITCTNQFLSSFSNNTGLFSCSTVTGFVTATGNNVFSGTNEFASSSLLVENPAKTFATTFTGSAITANRTLNLPLQTQTETIAVKPSLNSTNPSDPTGTTSTTGVMTGMLAGFTPTVTGRVQIIVEGDLSSLLAADGVKVDLRTGTGANPANAAALSGTVCGKAVQVSAVNSAANQIPFVLTCQVTGLTIGTHIWIEMGQYAISASTASVKNIVVSVMEI